MYPARYLFQFLEHHGMLKITGSPQWYSVVGGSRNYVDRVAARLGDARAARRAGVVLVDSRCVDA
jgi:predicted NAD/FAD-binding protein